MTLTGPILDPYRRHLGAGARPQPQPGPGRLEPRRTCRNLDPMSRLTTAEAEELLDGLPLIPAMAGSIPEMKALRDRCLAAGIPVLVGCPPGDGKAGKAGKG